MDNRLRGDWVHGRAALGKESGAIDETCQQDHVFPPSFTQKASRKSGEDADDKKKPGGFGPLEVDAGIL